MLLPKYKYMSVKVPQMVEGRADFMARLQVFAVFPLVIRRYSFSIALKELKRMPFCQTGLSFNTRQYLGYTETAFPKITKYFFTRPK